MTWIQCLSPVLCFAITSVQVAYCILYLLPEGRTLEPAR